ncbi:MAG: beta strand repeat-containing protein [Phycisphaerae bacterium]
MRTLNNTLGRTQLVTAAAALLAVGSAHAAITLNLVGTQLTINSSGADFITIGGVIDASNPFNVSGQASGINAGQVTQLTINCNADAQLIALSTVSQAAFSQLTGVTINCGGGSDQVSGSQLADTITDPDGGDILDGATGSDTFVITLSGSGGNVSITDTGGTLQVTGSSGDDSFTVTGASVALAAQTISFNANTLTTISIDGSTGNDTFNTVALTSTGLTFTGGDATDTLNVDAELAAATQGASTVSVTGKQVINHATVETVLVFNTADNPGGGPNGNSNSGGNTNTNSGSNTNTNTGGSTNTNSDGSTNTNSGGTVNENSGGTTNENSDGGSGSNTNGSGGSNANGNGNGDTDGDGDPNNDPNDPPITERNGCGALCGAGMMPMLPLMFGTLAALKLRRRRND